MFRKNRFSLLACALMAAAEAQESTGGAATESAAAAEARKRAPAANFLPIVRGRLPLIFVHAIRFNAVLNAMGNKDLATKFGTSVGKVFDIKKGRNFSYVTAGFKPTAEDVAAAEAWIAQVGGQNSKGLSAAGDKSVLQSTLDEYKGKGLATPEEAAKQATARTATRAVSAAKAEGGTAPATKKAAVKPETVQADASGKAAALLK
jgi:hypothetical protein